jgi:uncharacterized protein YqeY
VGDLAKANRIREHLRASLRVAIKGRDTVAMTTFRSTLSAIDNAEAVSGLHPPETADGRTAHAKLGIGVGDVTRRQLSTHDVIELVRAEIAERISAAAEYEHRGRAELAARLRAEANVLVAYLNDEGLET